jgi:hypothetical protein
MSWYLPIQAGTLFLKGLLTTAYLDDAWHLCYCLSCFCHTTASYKSCDGLLQCRCCRDGIESGWSKAAIGPWLTEYQGAKLHVKR